MPVDGDVVDRLHLSHGLLQQPAADREVLAQPLHCQERGLACAGAGGGHEHEQEAVGHAGDIAVVGDRATFDEELRG